MSAIVIYENDGIVTYAIGAVPPAGPLAIDFPYFFPDEIVVNQDVGTSSELLVVNDDYFLNGIAADDGFHSGSITMIRTVTNCTIRITRNLRTDKSHNFPETGAISIPAMNTLFSRIFSLLQDTRTRLSRFFADQATLMLSVLQVPPGENTDVIAPPKAERSGRYSTWDMNGDFVVSTKTVTEVEGATDIVWNGTASFDPTEALVVDSLGALQGLLSRPKLVITEGRTTAGDRGGGSWVWRPGDQSAKVTSDPASGLWAAPFSATSGASGAWQRLTTGSVVYAEWFGAKGDDVANDTFAIQGMSAACHDFNLIMGFVSARIYRCSGPINITPNIGGIEGNGAWLRSTGVSTDCFYFEAGNFEQANFRLPNILDYTNGAGIRLRGTANLDVYCHSIYNCRDGFMSETDATFTNTINNRFVFMKIGVCTQAGIRLKTGTDPIFGHQSQQGLSIRGNFVQGNLYAVFCDFRDAPNQTVGMNDIVMEIDGLEGMKGGVGEDALVGNTHGNTVLDGIASTAGLTAGPICGPGVDVGTTFIITGPNSIQLSQPARTTLNGQYYYANNHVGFYCPVGTMNGPWILRASEFMGGFGLGDVICPQGFNGCTFVFGWPASVAYGGIVCPGSSTFQNLFQGATSLGRTIYCTTATNTRHLFNSGAAAGFNRMYLAMQLDPAGYTAPSVVTGYFYSPLINTFDTPLSFSPINMGNLATLSAIVTDDNPSGLNVPYQLRVIIYFPDGTGPNPTDLQFRVDIGV